MKEIEAYFPKDYLARQGGSVDEVMKKLEAGTARFSEALTHLDETTLHQPVSEGKWSPAEIADHVVRVNRNITRAIQRTTQGLRAFRLAAGQALERRAAHFPRVGFARAGPLPGGAAERLAGDSRSFHKQPRARRSALTKKTNRAWFNPFWDP